MSGVVVLLQVPLAIARTVRLARFPVRQLKCKRVTESCASEKGTGVNRSMPPPVGRVLLVADMRSPTTWGWVDAVQSADVTVLGVDGRPWPERRPTDPRGVGTGRRAKQLLRSFLMAAPGRFDISQAFLRATWPLLASIKGRRLRRVIRQAKPDVVRALRIPDEAMIGAIACPQGIPLAVSIWGNDLTLHAAASRLTGRATRRVLARADLLFADCRRDIELARMWGLRPTTPAAVLPGGGGIDLQRVVEGQTLISALGCVEGPSPRLIVNARGCRQYVRNDVLLSALSLLAADLDPNVYVLFVDGASDQALRRSVERHELAGRIVVTGKYSSADVFSIFRQAEISVSITDHDGTPNSLLEAMAAGAIPVCGDLPSIREWIEHGRNGFLAASSDSVAVSHALGSH